MRSDVDIYRAAHLMMHSHGCDAELEAAKVTMTGSFSASFSSVFRFLVPGDRPLGLPDWPFLKRVWRGGLP
jgi:hypothetical protein